MTLFSLLFISCNGASNKGEGTVQIDSDMDGFSAEEDCNDQDNLIYPGAEERCDNVDNNCDGVIDEETDQYPD